MADSKTKLITSYFESDHKHLDHLFEQFLLLKHTNWPEAKRCFFELKQGLIRHMELEEEIMFPIFENHVKALGNRKPIGILTVEHQKIKSVLERIHQNLEEGKLDTTEDEDLFWVLLIGHNQKENEILYPFIDELISESEKEEVIQKLKCSGHLN